MYRLNFFLVLVAVLFLSGCYHGKTVVELNPDGSGIVTTTVDFDNSSEAQRQQVQAMLNDPNMHSGYSREKLAEKFPTPYFDIVEQTADEQGLFFKIVIKFKDINRLLTVDPQRSMLHGVDFTVDGDEIEFKVKRSSQESGFGPSVKTTGKAGKTGKVLAGFYPQETIRIVDVKSGSAIEFLHEYAGDETEKEIVWTGRLKLGGHSIKREVIKYNFADYLVLNSSGAEVTEASFNRYKSVGMRSFKSTLDLAVAAALPVSEEGTSFIGYDQLYLISGVFSDGSPVQMAQDWQGGMKKFNDDSHNDQLGLGKFKLPLVLAFPQRRVDELGAMTVRLRLVRGKALKRVDLGQLAANHTYDATPFSFITEDLANDELKFKVNGPVNRISDFYLKTSRGNLFHLRPSSWPSSDSSGSFQFWKFLPLSGASLLVDVYDAQDYAWLDVQVPALDLKGKKDNVPAVLSGRDLLLGLFPEYKDFPIVPDGIYKDLDAFKAFWGTLKDDEIIPALLEVLSDIKRLEKNTQINSWWQGELGKNLKTRSGFDELKRRDLARAVFKLYLELPDQNANRGIAYFLFNAGLSDDLRGDALTAIKDHKLRNGIGSFFKGALTDEERRVLLETFQASREWVESVELLHLLTEGSGADLALARRTLEDKSRDVNIRNTALEILIDGDPNFSSDSLKEQLMDSAMRFWVMNLIRQRLDYGHVQGKISKESLLNLLRPLQSVFEDLAEEKNGSNRQEIVAILTALH